MAMVLEPLDLRIEALDPSVPVPWNPLGAPGLFSDSRALELTDPEGIVELQGYRAAYSNLGPGDPIAYLETMVAIYADDELPLLIVEGLGPLIQENLPSATVETVSGDTVITASQAGLQQVLRAWAKGPLFVLVHVRGRDTALVSETSKEAAEAFRLRVESVLTGQRGYGPLPGVMEVAESARWSFIVDDQRIEVESSSGRIACHGSSPLGLDYIVDSVRIQLPTILGGGTISADGDPVLSTCGTLWPGSPALFSLVEPRSPAAFVRWVPDLEGRQGVLDEIADIPAIRIDLSDDYQNYLDRLTGELTVDQMDLWVAEDESWLVGWEATIGGPTGALQRNGFDVPSGSSSTHYSFVVTDASSEIAVPAITGSLSTPPPETSVVFTSDRMAGTLDIFLMTPDGVVRRLTDHPNGDEFPSFSPDGETIVFVSRRQGNDSLYLIDRDGSNLRRLTAPLTDGGDSWPCWSPDGRHIVFASDRAGGSDELWVIGVDGSNPRQITDFGPGTTSFWPSWSPDGSRIAFVSNFETGGPFEVYTIRPDGSGLRRLTDDARGDGYLRPVWFPDSQRLMASRRIVLPEFVMIGRPGEPERIDGAAGTLGTITRDGRYLVFSNLGGDLSYLDFETGATGTFTHHPGLELAPSTSQP